jgi:hypothetical protein
MFAPFTAHNSLIIRDTETFICSEVYAIVAAIRVLKDSGKDSLL